MKRKWELVVRLAQLEFGDGTVTEEIAWEMMVILPKGKGEYQEIELVEVLWKVCSVVVHFHSKRSVVLHDEILEFRKGQGGGGGYSGGQAVTTAGQDFIRSPLPGFLGCLKGV